MGHAMFHHALRTALLALLLTPAASSSAGAIDDARVLMIGHSLVNFDMPWMLAALADDAGKTHQRGEQITIGGALKANWENSHLAQGLDARVALPTGDWDVLVMTEAIPLQNHLTWSDTYLNAGNFHQLALDGNPSTRTFIYETWHCINSGTPTGCPWDDGDHVPWRQRLDDDLPKWRGIADHLNADFAGPRVTLVPAGQALARLHDRIEGGAVPGMSHVFELFPDDIHLNHAGNYFVALVMYAAIYRESPVGLTHQIGNEWGTPYTLPSEATATAMQEIAWEVVSAHLGLDDALFSDGFEPASGMTRPPRPR